MKTYVITTGTIFGLLTLAHIGRAIAEGGPVASDPWYILLTIVSGGLCLWAASLVWRKR